MLLNRLLDKDSPESSKRFIALILVGMMLVITIVALTPYQIPKGNIDLLEYIIVAFVGLIMAMYGIDAASTIKELKYGKSKDTSSDQ